MTNKMGRREYYFSNDLWRFLFIDIGIYVNATQTDLGNNQGFFPLPTSNLVDVKQVRLGWHDAGTYNKNIQEWPQRGGANGSLRFEIELKHAANAGND